MAIEKTVFTGTTGDAMASEIAAWLTANASEFFDRIEIDSDTHVYCYIDGVRAVHINTDTTGTSYISAKNDKYTELAANGTNWLYGVKTSKGIAVYNASGDYRYCIMATKSNEGTVSLAMTGTNIYACADFDKSSDLVDFKTPTRVDNTFVKSGMTVLAPIVNANALTYADGLYLQVFSQYPNVDGIFTINGKQYYTDGVLALEE
jgi:hypothetical protein